MKEISPEFCTDKEFKEAIVNLANLLRCNSISVKPIFLAVGKFLYDIDKGRDSS